MNRYRVGSREWQADFERRRRRFDQMWPLMVALSIAAAVTTLVLVATGVLPLWVLFIG
jgi:hypothetical protein